MDTLFCAHEICDIVESDETKEMARFKPTYFTRKRLMPFMDILYFMLNPAKASLQTKLNRFFKLLGKKGMTISQQSFSKARSHFDHSPFEKMTRRLVSLEYGGDFPLETWNGYHVFGVDGSTVILPPSAELKDEYGVMKNQSEKEVNCARISILFDVLHDWILDASIDPYTGSERDFAKKHVDFMKTHMTHLQKSVILFDRGYPSLDFVEYLQTADMHFLMRCQRNWVIDVRNAPMGDSISVLRNGIKVRIYKFVLPSGEVEILITNLFDISADELPGLYFLRWGVEGKYDVLKNKIELENFSGCTKNAILQDFWVSVTLSIVVAIAKKEADEKIQSKVQGKNNRRKQKPNVSQLVGSLKDDFVMACRLPTETLRKIAIDAVIHEISRAVVTVRPDREPHKRDMNRKKKQYPMNRKSNI